MINAAIHHTTTSAANDETGEGPEYRGHVLCITIWRWTFEFTIARRA